MWDHFVERQSDKKVVCQYEDGNKAKCGTALRMNLTTMAYHLTDVHGLEQGSPAKKQKLMTSSKSMFGSGVILTEKEHLCLTWACNALSYELVDDKHFRRSFGLVIPQCDVGCATFGSSCWLLSAGVSRVTLSADMILFAQKMKAALGKVVMGEAVTLAVDGGKVHRKLQSLSIIVGQRAYYLLSIPV